MFQRSASDLEAQSTPGASRDGSRLKDAPPRYEKYIKSLDASKQRPELSEELFWYQELGPSSTNKLEFFSKDKKYRHKQFGDCRMELQRMLGLASKTSTASLQLCILNTTPVSNEIYSYATQLFSTKVNSAHGIASFPRYAVAVEIEQAWGGLSECSYKSIQRPEQLARVEQLSLPEFRRQFLSHTDSNCKCKTFRIHDITNHYDRRPLRSVEVDGTSKKSLRLRSTFNSSFSVDLPSQAVDTERTPVAVAQVNQCSHIFDRGAASFTFTWQRAAPTYHGGIDTFLWERHSQPPSCDYAEVFYQDDRASSMPRRALMTVSTTPDWLKETTLIHDLKALLNEEKENEDHMWTFLRRLRMQEIANSDVYSLVPLFIVFEQVIRDTAYFLQQASDQIRKISFAGRSGASIEKIQYLCHLSDCRQSSVHGLEHIQSVVTDLLSAIRQHRGLEDGASVEVEFLETKNKDLEHLIICLTTLKSEINTEVDFIRAHRALAQSRQISILTYIATIWVPLSFVTGMLGMQVSDPAGFFHHSSRGDSSSSVSATPTDSSSSATNTSIAARQVAVNSTSATPTPTQLSNVTALLTAQLAEESVIATSTPYVWSFGLFIGLSGVFFVFSLMLPLVGPNLTRIAVQRSYKIRNLWIFWPFVFATYYVIVYWVIPEAMMGYLECGSEFCNRYTDGFYFIQDFATAGWNPINTITYIVSAVVMGSIGLVNIALAIMFRRGAGNTSVWLVFAVVVIVVYVVEYYESVEESYPFAIGTGLSLTAIVPLAYLLVVWSVPQLWDWWNEKRMERKEKIS